MKYLQINDNQSYKRAFHLSTYVWNVVYNWHNFSERTVDQQFVTVIDSVAEIITEGFGRNGNKDNIIQ